MKCAANDTTPELIRPGTRAQSQRVFELNEPSRLTNSSMKAWSDAAVSSALLDPVALGQHQGAEPGRPGSAPWTTHGLGKVVFYEVSSSLRGR
jgi:hypothetical protein